MPWDTSVPCGLNEPVSEALFVCVFYYRSCRCSSKHCLQEAMGAVGPKLWSGKAMAVSTVYLASTMQWSLREAHRHYFHTAYLATTPTWSFSSGWVTTTCCSPPPHPAVLPYPARLYLFLLHRCNSGGLGASPLTGTKGVQEGIKIHTYNDIIIIQEIFPHAVIKLHFLEWCMNI